MSYTISLTIDTGYSEPHVVWEITMSGNFDTDLCAIRPTFWSDIDNVIAEHAENILVSVFDELPRGSAALAPLWDLYVHCTHHYKTTVRVT